MSEPGSRFGHCGAFGPASRRVLMGDRASYDRWFTIPRRGQPFADSEDRARSARQPDDRPAGPEIVPGPSHAASFPPCFGLPQ